MKGLALSTLREALADVTARRRRARVAEAMNFGARSADQMRADERNVTMARNLYFNLAVDRAEAQRGAGPTFDGLLTLHLQELALREAADMVASRIRTGMATRGAAQGR